MSQGNASLSVLSGNGEEVSVSVDLGLCGLVLVAQYHGVAADAAQLAHELGSSGEAFDETTLLLAARKLGLEAEVSVLPASRLPMANSPALGWDREGRAFMIARIQGEQALIHDLADRRPRQLSLAELEQRYGGRLMQAASRASVMAAAWISMAWW
ncbi:MAG TPA: cysteine peptidase family C39 domain-containing protein [Stenotrophomonas sp.]